MNKYKDWFASLSCALDNVPTDQPSAPKVDTNQLTKKNWRTLSLPLAESISSWYVPTEPTQSSSGPISSLKTSLERRLNCACACVCVRESGRATLLKLRAVPWPVRERDESSHHHHQHCKPPLLLLFLLFAVEVGGQLQRSMHDLVAPEVKLCRLQKLESSLHGDFCERDHLWLYSFTYFSNSILQY